MTVVRVQVTQADIDNGERAEPCLCPTALAIKRVFPACDPSVDGVMIELRIDGKTWFTDVPESVREFVEAFDEEWPVEPFGFDLDVPDLLAGAS